MLVHRKMPGVADFFTSMTDRYNTWISGFEFYQEIDVKMFIAFIAETALEMGVT